MESTWLIIALTIVSLELISSASDIKKVSTVTKLPDNIDQYFNSSLGLTGDSQWYVLCKTMGSNSIFKNCTFWHGKTYLTENRTMWTNHDFQMEKRTNSSTIYPDYLRVFQLTEHQFLVIWIEYDLHSQEKVKHVDDKEIMAGLYVKFTTIDIRRGKINNGSTTGSSVIPNLKGNGIRFLQGYIESLEIVTFDHKFGIAYRYPSDPFLAQEIFNFDCKRLYGPVVYDARNYNPKKYVHGWAKYPKDRNDWQRVKPFHLGLCDEMFCSAENYDGNTKQLGGCSTFNNVTTACFSKEPGKLMCKQRNQNSQITIGPTTLRTINPMAKFIWVYSLNDGEVLILIHVENRVLVISRAENSQSDVSDVGAREKVFNSFRLKRFSIDGKNDTEKTVLELHFEISSVFVHMSRDRTPGWTCLSVLWTNQTFMGFDYQCSGEKGLNRFPAVNP
ncbi:hypothetical protein QAD02_010854 [Eretmocerus hayati]|uniref:Uncharacterized protein n=1 Tax=Eretmocerus hayati TaxID=131215 RepID=A0ACC2NV43_9HYME|nr:hypothetical protein QAD02_010854 [Eretmocerus hayati]